MEAAAHALLGTTRARFEKDLIGQLVAAGRVPLVVDGALTGRQPHDGLLGVVKTEVVIISENKDTAINFPPLACAISVEGVGRGAGAIAGVPWFARADLVVYWGDMDADGLEILNEFRAAGIDAVSMFMDLSAFQRWERFGTNTDPQGRQVRTGLRRPVPYLTPQELDLYEALTSREWQRMRRIEQERIPLSLACAKVTELVALG